MPTGPGLMTIRMDVGQYCWLERRSFPQVESKILVRFPHSAIFKTADSHPYALKWIFKNSLKPDRHRAFTNPYFPPWWKKRVVGPTSLTQLSPSCSWAHENHWMRFCKTKPYINLECETEAIISNWQSVFSVRNWVILCSDLFSAQQT